MEKPELKKGMWCTWNDYFGGNVGDPHTIKLVGQSDAYIKQRMEQGEVIYNHPATKPEIAKELGWELAKAEKTRQEILSEYALCNIEDDDYTYQMEKNDIGIRKLLAEIESGVDDEKE